MLIIADKQCVKKTFADNGDTALLVGGGSLSIKRKDSECDRKSYSLSARLILPYN